MEKIPEMFSSYSLSLVVIGIFCFFLGIISINMEGINYYLGWGFLVLAFISLVMGLLRMKAKEDLEFETRILENRKLKKNLKEVAY